MNQELKVIADSRDAQRPVIAYHVIFCAYGFWLPNDPRGSNSDFVGSPAIFQFGPATKTDSRRSVARKPHDIQARLAAKRALKYPPVVFDGRQAQVVARAFARIVAKCGHIVYACAILPQHVHLVIARHSYRIEQVVRLLKAGASTELAASNLHPLASFAPPGETPPTPWGADCRKVFLFTDEEIVGRIHYVEMNPVKEGKRKQNWSFVTPFTGTCGTAVSPVFAAKQIAVLRTAANQEARK
ncbi:MAG: hypothetical protein HZA51_18385 [Planctomycetes bacterium]|nr:hypothetical protein [Planctomycetota bacterium]